jgi:hypothetical protein
MAELKEGDEIPQGPTLETALDRLQRASNFAGNGVFVVENGFSEGAEAETIAMYIRFTRDMLAEAEKALAGLAQSSSEAGA